MKKAGLYPDVVIGCVGGGSDFAGLAFPFVCDKIHGKNLDIIGVEPTACPTMTKAPYVYDFGDTAKTTPLIQTGRFPSRFNLPFRRDSKYGKSPWCASKFLLSTKSVFTFNVTMQDELIDCIPDGVFTVDNQWRIMLFNRVAEQITGISRAEAIGRRCCDVFRASICESACALKQTLATGRPVVNKVVYVVDAKGQRIPISISTAILKDKRGQVVGGVESFRDLRLVEELHRQAQEQDRFADIIGRSGAMRRIFEILPQIAESDSTALVEGASGTGKELFARAIHNMSRRRSKRLVAINCSALPDTLLESELFGYKAGAFTDARKDKPGRFALAEGGTLLLDEIGDISPAMQTRLLRVLQERVYEPLGSVDSVKANVRVIAATNKSLSQLVRDGKFREDLYYRVHIIRIELPSLRDRREDIPLLIDHFVAQFNRRQGKDVGGVSDEVLARLMEYEFPGNVRELENIIEHAFVLCRGGLVKMAHLPPHLRPLSPAVSRPKVQGMTLQAVEKMMVQDALRRNQGNKTQAARELGIDASTMFRKIKALGINASDYARRK